MLSGAFVPCCWDICLLNHPSPELQGGSQCHPILPSLPYPTACGLWPRASAPPGPGQPSPSTGAWLALSVEYHEGMLEVVSRQSCGEGALGHGGCVCVCVRAHLCRHTQMCGRMKYGGI